MKVLNIALISALFFIALLIWLITGDKEIIPIDFSQLSVRTIVEVGNVSIKIEVAGSREAREKGLSGRDSLLPNSGLLFVFEKSDTHGIWMKNMRFPIDIIWISDTLSVVDIKRNATVASYPDIFYPRRNARYVLEVNANFTEVRGIQIGDSVRLPPVLRNSSSE